MARRCRRFKTTRAGRRCASYGGYGDPGKRRRRRRYRGYGQALQVYSGFGALDVGLDAFLPPLVGGGAAVGTSLLLRAFVDPATEDPAKAPHWAFKYAGFIGAGAGVLAGGVLGFAQKSYGSAIAAGLTAVATGLCAQFFNKVVPEDRQNYRGYGRYGLVAMQPRWYGRGYGQLPRAYSGAYGAMMTAPTARRFALPGRGEPSMMNPSLTPSVMAAVNRSAFGGSPTLGAVV